MNDVGIKRTSEARLIRSLEPGRPIQQCSASTCHCWLVWRPGGRRPPHSRNDKRSSARAGSGVQNLHWTLREDVRSLLLSNRSGSRCCSTLQHLLLPVGRRFRQLKPTGSSRPLLRTTIYRPRHYPRVLHSQRSTRILSSAANLRRLFAGFSPGVRSSFTCMASLGIFDGEGYRKCEDPG